MARRIAREDAIVDAKYDVATDWRWSVDCAAEWSRSVETTAVEAMMCVPIAPDATRLRGRGFLYERENCYGDQKGGKEVY